MNLPAILRLSSREISLLKKSNSFQSATSELFKIKFYKRGDTKIAIVIGKKYLLKSSKRNIFRRRLKSILYSKYTNGSLEVGYYIIILKSPIKDLPSYEKINLEINNIISKIS